MVSARLNIAAWYIAVVRTGFLAAIVLAVIPFGAVHRIVLDASSLFIALVALASSGVRIVDARVQRLRNWAVTLMIILLSVVVAQSVKLPNHPFAHPIWAEANALLGTTGGAISVSPSAGLAAIGGLASPFLIFIAGLAVFQGDRAALRLWRFLGLGGAAIAVLGLAQFVVDPGHLLLAEKIHYRDSLTAVFVNRNTAASFLGVTSLLLTGLIVGSATDRGITMRGLMAGDGAVPFADVARVIGLAVLLVAVVTALFLTRSRGGVVATAVAAVCLVVVLARSSTQERRAARRGGLASLPTVYAAAGTFAIIGVVAVFGERVVARLASGIADDGRFCVLPGILRAVGDNWMLGTGFATFDQVFPQYRDPACGLGGAWVRAHNSFLEGLLGFGILLLPVLVAGYVVLTMALWRGVRERRRRRVFPAVGLAVVVLMSLHALIDFSMQIQGVRVFVAAVLAAATTLANRPSLRRAPTG